MASRHAAFEGIGGQPKDCMDIWLKSCVEKTDEPADEKRIFDPLKERKRRADLPKGIFRVAIA